MSSFVSNQTTIELFWKFCKKKKKTRMNMPWKIILLIRGESPISSPAATKLGYLPPSRKQRISLKLGHVSPHFTSKSIRKFPSFGQVNQIRITFYFHELWLVVNGPNWEFLLSGQIILSTTLIIILFCWTQFIIVWYWVFSIVYLYLLPFSFLKKRNDFSWMVIIIKKKEKINKLKADIKMELH